MSTVQPLAVYLRRNGNENWGAPWLHGCGARERVNSFYKPSHADFPMDIAKGHAFYFGILLAFLSCEMYIDTNRAR